jgi:hypothetical protein
MRAHRWIRALALVAVSAFVGATIATNVAESEGGALAHPEPLGKKKYIVLMADAVLPLSEAMEPRGELFQRQVMKRTPEEVSAYKAKAVSFFGERFGLDFSSGDSAQGTTLMHIVSSPKVNYRAYTISGETVPASGWEVRDLSYVAVVGPGGATLHGTWGGSAGRAVPEGSLIPFGDYYIAAEAPDGARRDPIVIHYEAIVPVPPLAPGTNPAFACDLASPEFGRGEAFGAIDIRSRPDGKSHHRIRNVLTFP